MTGIYHLAFFQKASDFDWFLFRLVRTSSTLIRHKNGSLRKRSANFSQFHVFYRRNSKALAFRLPVVRKHFENEAFRKRWRHSLTKFSSKKKSKMTGDCSVFKVHRRSMDEEH